MEGLRAVAWVLIRVTSNLRLAREQQQKIRYCQPVNRRRRRLVAAPPNLLGQTMWEPKGMSKIFLVCAFLSNLL